MELPINKILTGCSLKVLKTLPEKSVHCIVTSPPYWGLRDYKVEPTKWPRVVFTIWGKRFVIPKMECCLGLEPTPEAYVGHLILIFREAKRVLRDDGVFWLNLGDSYASSQKDKTDLQQTKNSKLQCNGKHQLLTTKQPNKIVGLLKAKDLIGIPWMAAFALRDDGWYLRMDNIWDKPNSIPEPVKDRATKAHEYIFQFNKSSRYYFNSDAIKTLTKDPKGDQKRSAKQTWDNKNTPDKLRNGIRPIHGVKELLLKSNKRSVWHCPTQPFKGSHYAVFPEKLIEPCIKAGCPEGGIVLDPFFGAGTTGLVAQKLNRKWIGIDVGPHNVKLADNRIRKEIGLFL